MDFTDKQLAKMQSMAAQGHTMKSIADELGVSHDVLYKHRNKKDEVHEVLELGRLEAIENNVKPGLSELSPDKSSGRTADLSDSSVYGGGVDARLDEALRCYARTGRLTGSLRRCKTEWMSHSKRLARDPDYAQRFKEAGQLWLEKLERIAFIRARHKSDRLLVKLLEGADPSKYRSNVNKHEHSGPGGGPIATSIRIIMEPSPENVQLPAMPEGDQDNP